MLTMINMLIKIISNDSIYSKYTIFIKTQFINMDIPVNDSQRIIDEKD